MGHSYNNGLHTTSKGITYDAVRITALTTGLGTACTIAEQAKSGLIVSVVHTATGVYTVTLSLPFLPKVVNIRADMSAAGPTAVVLAARYQNGSYNATTGTFIINTTNTNGAPIATDPGAADEMHIHMAFNRYTN